MAMIHITECSASLIQGLKFVPTQQRKDYADVLMSVGFDVLDFGSFLPLDKTYRGGEAIDIVSEVDKTLSNTKVAVAVRDVNETKKVLRYSSIDVLNVSFCGLRRNKDKHISLQEVKTIFDMYQKSK